MAMAKIILASSSPYRKALLERLGITFDCVSPDVDEDKYKEKINNPVELAQTLAKLKAQAVFEKNKDCIVIGSDQLLSFEGKTYGKPKTATRAFEQLRKLSGKTHKLITSYCVLHPSGEHIETNITKLEMRELSDDLIKNYLSEDNPIDCAGSYKLELKGISLFKAIRTDDHTAIIGLPLLSLGTYLATLGINFPAPNTGPKDRTE